MTYSDTLAYVASRAPLGWRLGLDRMEAFLKHAGLTAFVNGPERPAYVHVAGTNGKGSTTAFLQSMMVESGRQTGAFFSPYVVDPRERVQVGREMIEPDEFASVVALLKPVVEAFEGSEYGGITEFELKTAIGFETWRRKGCEAVALEVGLGGRLDATNVVLPASCAIVSIGWDHMALLGDTLGKIATEKAGILKPGVPAVAGEMDPEALASIEARAAEVGSPLWRVGREVGYRRAENGVTIRTPRSEVTVRPSLWGPVQAHNVAVAYAAMELAFGTVALEVAIRGAERTFAPGRMQRLGDFLLDGAHNVNAGAELARTLANEGIRPRAVVFGMLTGHEAGPLVAQIGLADVPWHLAPIDFHRARSPQSLAAEIDRGAVAHVSVEAAIRAARSERGEGPVLVTGSFYLVGEVARHLGFGAQAAG